MTPQEFLNALLDAAEPLPQEPDEADPEVACFLVQVGDDYPVDFLVSAKAGPGPNGVDWQLLEVTKCR